MSECILLVLCVTDLCDGDGDGEGVGDGDGDGVGDGDCDKDSPCNSDTREEAEV